MAQLKAQLQWLDQLILAQNWLGLMPMIIWLNIA